MSSKEVFQEVVGTEGYETEFRRILDIGSVEHAVLFYHYACYYFSVLKKPFICKDSFEELCDFITDYKEELPASVKEYINLDDVLNYTCFLTEAPLPVLQQKGKHFISNIKTLVEEREDTFHINFSLERWEELYDRSN